MHQAVDAGSQTHKDAEVGDRLDRALDAVAALGVLGKFLPRVGLALLHAQRNAALVFVDFQNHDFDFVTQGDEFVRCHVLVGPVHLGHVDQAFNAWLEFDKCAVVGDVGDLAEQAGSLRVAACHAHPRVVAHLFETQRDTVFLGVELQDLGHDFLTGCHHFARVTHAAPCHVGDVQQAVNAAQVNECTVFGDVLDDAFDSSAFFEGFHQLGAFFAHAGFDHSAAAQHHVVAFAVELDDLELHGLVLVGSQVLDGACVDQRTWQESADAVDQHGQAAFDFAAGLASDKFAGFESFFQAHPRSQALGLVAREQGVAVAVFDRVDGHRHKIADLDFEFALVVFEFFERHIGLGLQTGIDHHMVVVDADDFGGNNFARAHFRALERFFKKGGKRFRH